jgi:CheY-like chemotaxis protein
MRALNGEIKAFDAILMDIRMPELDGIEVTRRIRRVESEMARGHTPIIALTANAFDEDRDQCLKAGFDEFLTKPIDREDLIACLGKAILEPALQNRTDLSSNAENPNYLR